MKFKSGTVDKAIKNERKRIRGEIGYRSRDYIFYKKHGDFFVCIYAWETGMENDKAEVQAKIKPMYLDEVFWDVMKMEENKTAALSLRADGAFTFGGLKVFSRSVKINDISEVSGVLDELIKKCTDTVEECLSGEADTDERFDALIEKYDDSVFDKELYMILRDINSENYGTAKQTLERLIGEGEMGRFGNEGKFIYELALEYIDGKCPD